MDSGFKSLTKFNIYMILSYDVRYTYTQWRKENDTQTPVKGAMLLQQKLTKINHPDHILITYPNLRHEFYPSTQWQTQQGPIQQYVLRDLYSWLEVYSGFTFLSTN
jgi:uncharacterized protein